jgi:hypothetical protein
MQCATFLERVTRNRLALNLSILSNVRRIAKPEIVEPDHNLRLLDRGYVQLERKDVCRRWVEWEHGDGMLCGMERFHKSFGNAPRNVSRRYPAELEAAGGSGELIVDWLRAHHLAVMSIDEKA